MKAKFVAHSASFLAVSAIALSDLEDHQLQLDPLDPHDSYSTFHSKIHKRI